MSVATLAERLATPVPGNRSRLSPGGSPLGAALWVAGGYALLLALWLALSDRAVLALAGSKEALATLQAWKGAGWLVVSTGLVFLLARAMAGRVAREARAAREMDARFRAFVGMAPMSLFEVRADGWLTFLSVGRKAAGMDPDHAAGLGWRDLVLPEDLATCLPAWATFAAADGPVLFERQLRLRLGGQARWVLVRVGRTRRRDRFVGVAIDITAWKEAEAALEAARLNARALDHARHQFLDSVGHELRSPLDTIIGFAEVLRGGVANHPDTVRDFARDIGLAGRQLLEALEDIRASAQLGSAPAGAPPESVDPDAEVRRAIRRLSDRYQGKRLAWVPAAASADLTLVADTAAFRHVLHMLLDNAARHSPPGGRVGVAANGLNGMVEVCVTDDGPGFPASVLEQAAGPLSDGMPQDGDGRLGVGVALALRLARRMGGSLHLSNRPQGGGRALLLLPALPPPADGRPETLMHRSRVALAALRADPSDLDPLFRAACRDLVEATGATRAGVWFFSLDGQALNAECLYDSRSDRFESGMVVTAAGAPGYFQALRRDRRVELAGGEGSLASYLAPTGIATKLDMVVAAGGQPVAVLSCERCGGQEGWTPEQVACLDRMALLLGMAFRARIDAISGRVDA